MSITKLQMNTRPIALISFLAATFLLAVVSGAAKAEPLPVLTIEQRAQYEKQADCASLKKMYPTCAIGVATASGNLLGQAEACASDYDGLPFISDALEATRNVSLNEADHQRAIKAFDNWVSFSIRREMKAANTPQECELVFPRLDRWRAHITGRSQAPVPNPASVPSFNARAYCERTASTSVEACLGIEQMSFDTVRNSWPRVAPATRKTCIARAHETSLDGTLDGGRSYMKLLQCVAGFM
jgi:hypothetical protein